MKLTTNSAVWGYTERDLFIKPPKNLKETIPSFDIHLNLTTNPDEHEIESYLIESIFSEFTPSSFPFHYLEECSKLNSIILPETNSFLSSYVVSLRKHSKIPKSIQEITKILLRISIAHSKLCMREVVQIEDCLVAIMLVEESFAYLYNCSLAEFGSKSNDQENILLLDGEGIDAKYHAFYQSLIEKFQ
jgi:hypothetical protein